MELVTCEYCKREWDGNAQCPCFAYMYTPSDLSNYSDDDYMISFKDASTQTKRYRWGPTKLEIAQKAVDVYMKNRSFNTVFDNIFQ